MIAYSVRQWQGTYWSKDTPRGVETVPYTTAVFVVPSDGGGEPQRVADLEGRAEAPVCSPDGRWIYFQAAVPGSDGPRHHIFRCREDGSGLQDLTAAHEPPGSRFGIGLSRDGTRLLFVYYDGAIGRVVMAAADGSNPQLIAPGIGYHYMADISPDNGSVVFAHTARGYVLTLKELDGGALRVLTPGLPDCYCPRFTADGRTIVFMRRDGDVYSVGADGSGLRRLTEGNRYVEFRLSEGDLHGSSDPPSLSPDGRQLAYVARVGGVPQVHVMNADGSGKRQLTFRAAPCGRAAFGPGGDRVAFVSWEGGHVQLFVVAAAGGEPVRLTHAAGAVCFIGWKPAGRF